MVVVVLADGEDQVGFPACVELVSSVQASENEDEEEEGTPQEETLRTGGARRERRAFCAQGKTHVCVRRQHERNKHMSNAHLPMGWTLARGQK